MWWFGSIIFLIIWVLIAFWPARVAARKGHSFLLFFIFSLFFFPAALIVAYIVKDRSRSLSRAAAPPVLRRPRQSTRPLVPTGSPVVWREIHGSHDYPLSHRDEMAIGRNPILRRAVPVVHKDVNYFAPHISVVDTLTTHVRIGEADTEAFGFSLVPHAPKVRRLVSNDHNRVDGCAPQSAGAFPIDDRFADLLLV